MSNLNSKLTAIKAAAFDLGIPTMAQKAGMKEDTLRRFLKKPPKPVENYEALQAIAAEHQADKEKAAGAVETGEN